MDRPDWAPPDVDINRPSAARMYDYYLGGFHNFGADRRAAEEVFAVLPDTPLVARANRNFLRRSVTFLTAAGIRQFIDIGSGIPTVGNVHEVARQAAPDSRVVYVDIDPVAVTHSRRILDGDRQTTVIQEDLRNPRAILAHPDLRSILDVEQPVAVLLMAVLHFVSDQDNPKGVLGFLRETLPSGSYLAVSHGTHEGRESEVERMRGVYRRGGTQVTSRDRGQIAALLDGFELVEPGIGWVSEWRPELHPELGEPEPAPRCGLIGAVGRVG